MDLNLTVENESTFSGRVHPKTNRALSRLNEGQKQCFSHAMFPDSNEGTGTIAGVGSSETKTLTHCPGPPLPEMGSGSQKQQVNF